MSLFQHANHPLNLALRFLLELGMLASLAWWGWSRAADGWLLQR